MTPALIAALAFLGASASIPAIAILGPKLVRPKERVPGYNTRVKDRPSFVTPHQLQSLLTAFQHVWWWRFGDDERTRSRLQKALDDLDIVFEEVDGVNRQGGYFENHCRQVAGVTPSKTLVKVVADQKLWRKALVHELVHVALWRIAGRPGADHQTPWTHKHAELIECVVSMLSADE